MSKPLTERKRKQPLLSFGNNVLEAELDFRFGKDVTNLSRPAARSSSLKKTKMKTNRKQSLRCKAQPSVSKTNFNSRVKELKKPLATLGTNRNKSVVEETIDIRNWRVPQAVAPYHKEILEYLKLQEVALS